MTPMCYGSGVTRHWELLSLEQQNTASEVSSCTFQRNVQPLEWGEAINKQREVLIFHPVRSLVHFDGENVFIYPYEATNFLASAAPLLLHTVANLNCLIQYNTVLFIGTC